MTAQNAAATGTAGSLKLAVIPGDGIGQEVTAEALKLEDDRKLLSTFKALLRQREIDFQQPKRTIETLNSATPARSPSKPSWLYNSLAAVFFGGLLGVGVAAALFTLSMIGRRRPNATKELPFESGILNFDRTWPDETQWLPPQTNDPIQNYGGKSCGGPLAEVFYRSCNIPFAQLAIELGADRMTAGARAWGIGEKLPIDLPAPASSNFENAGSEPIDFSQNLPLLAIAGFGQANDKMVPLHMCMVASTVANGGRMMRPYVVDRTLEHDGRIISVTQPGVWKTPISAGTAAALNQLMIGVVNNGTGTPMQLAGGIQAAAKTGTAQLNATGEPQRSHAWIIGYAPAEAPRYAVAVVLKGTNDDISASTGGRLAGPIANKVLDYLFSTEGR